MGRLAEMQRKLLEVCTHRTYAFFLRKFPQQMMGPEAMGVTNANLVWSDEKVCRNFLCGTCPHALFTNTVSLTSFKLEPTPVSNPDTFGERDRKWTWVRVPNRTRSVSRPSSWLRGRPTQTTRFSTDSRWNMSPISSRLWMNVTDESARHTGGLKRRRKRMQRRRTW